MDTNSVNKVRALLRKAGVPEHQHNELLAHVAEALLKAEADRRGMTVGELAGFSAGKSIGAAINERFGYGRKS